MLVQCPRQDSNLRLRLRRPTLYPLSYEGQPLNFNDDGVEATGQAMKSGFVAVRHATPVSDPGRSGGSDP